MPDVALTKIAVPLQADKFSAHFGQSTHVAIFTIDPAAQAIVSQQVLPVPGEHACGMATWLQSQGVQAMIVGGIGQGAIANLMAAGILVWGAEPGYAPETLVRAALAQKVHGAPQGCQHHGRGGCHDHGAHGHGHHHDHGQGHGCHGAGKSVRHP